MNRPHGRLDFVGIAVVRTAACTRDCSGWASEHWYQQQATAVGSYIS